MCHKRTIFLDGPTSVVGAVKDLGDSIPIFLCGVSEEVLPAMLAEDAVEVGVIFAYFDDDHGARLVKDGGVNIDGCGKAEDGDGLTLGL